MKKFTKQWLPFLVVLFFFIPISGNAEESTTSKVIWALQEDVRHDKDWTIKFNITIDEKSITPSTVYVLDSMQNPVNNRIELLEDKKSIRVYAPPEQYTPGETYTIYLTTDIRSEEGNLLKKQTEIPFSIHVFTDSIDPYTSYERLANSANNFSIVYDNGFIYYRGENDGIIKESVSNPMDRKVITSESPTHLLVHEGWIYYSNVYSNGQLYRVKTDGTQNEKLTDGTTFFINEYKGELYFNQKKNKDDDNSWYIQKMNIDTKKITDLVRFDALQIQISHDWVYMRHGDGSLARVRTTGERFEVLPVRGDYPVVREFVVIGDTIIFENERGDLYQMDTNLYDPQHIHNAMVRDGVLANPNQVLSFVVNRNTLYYLLSVSKTDKPTVYEIWKMDLGTREKEKIVTGPYRYLDLVGGTLYSFNNEKSEFEKIEQ